MINRIERPLANDHPDGSFSVHLFLHRPKTQISQIIGQYTHNLLGLKTLSFALLLFIHKNIDLRSPSWVRHAKCTWSSYFRFCFNHVCSRYSHYFDVLFCSSSFKNKLFICIVEAVEKKVLR